MQQENKRDYTPRNIMTLAKKLGTLEQRKDLHALLTTYIENEELELLRQEEERQQKAAKITELFEKMADSGIDIQDLVAASQGRPSTGQRRPYKKRKKLQQPEQPAQTPQTLQTDASGS
ncbi:hypothetical protein E4188_23715 (plasmid) [Aeromonas media]|uniref:DNA-binding protein H-NS-like N-terminal domain-containing protein n=2 Tax=Aeromonas TaxID=642 RepID=A0ABX6P097_AERME|nr:MULTISPECIES: hypothetical protein [Aeromonas]ASI21281.1 hypothetical protein CE456_00025 [Aeromonas salmonicida]QJT41499.1 hypothetical protein E4188_23715 [Aeromonas media]QLI59101.1 hypothetical protein C0708_23420 [Aeromonas caviae]QLI60328.1 hypothetical protein C1C91_23065 [Aeromonas caviae]HDN9373703.1 hypothetical protein [Aeromonas salmonicida]